MLRLIPARLPIFPAKRSPADRSGLSAARDRRTDRVPAAGSSAGRRAAEARRTHSRQGDGCNAQEKEGRETSPRSDLNRCSISILLKKVLEVGKKRSGGPGNDRIGLPQCHRGQRRHVFPLSADHAGRGRVGRQLLLQAQPIRQRMHERMIEMQRDPNLGDDPGGEVAPADVFDLVGQNSAALVIGPARPIAGKQENRPSPTDRRRRAQCRTLAQVDVSMAAELDADGVKRVRQAADRRADASCGGNLARRPAPS